MIMMIMAALTADLGVLLYFYSCLASAEGKLDKDKQRTMLMVFRFRLSR